jgi:acyl-CoA hydrolase
MDILKTTDACVDAVLTAVGKRISLATPLGIGKPNHLLNALYRRAQADPSIELTIHTALTLSKPVGASELERRLLGPLIERLFGDYPDLDYERDRLRDALPRNVRVIEFYLLAGAYLHSQVAQRDYIASNYTHVARDLLARGVNVAAQQVCAGQVQGRPKLSLSCNPDLSIDVQRGLLEQRAHGKAVACVAQINDRLPFMYGEAVVEPDSFDYVVDNPEQYHSLFAPPKVAVNDADTMIGVYASALVRDGGELQIGIGALGDALSYALELRQKDNARYASVLTELQVQARSGAEIAQIGELGRFEQGLFAASEMLVDGFMPLFQAGILKRKVYDDVALSSLLNERCITERVQPEMLDLLCARKAIHEVLTAADFAYLQYFGILRAELRFEAGLVQTPDGENFLPDLRDPVSRARLHAWLGTELEHGAVAHAGFFVGPTAFYQWLRDLPEAERRLIDMRSVTRINQLYGHEQLDRLQRRDARFINTCMKMSLLGAATSDALEDGRVVSGVGGQYNFVAMAHELPGGRSILQLRSTRFEGRELHSNLVWNYANTTIPRHLRDLVITEYGIADLRGKTDGECVRAMLQLCDTRFQEALLAQAKRVGKLRSDYRIPELYRANLPAAYTAPLAALRTQGLFPAFPFGTDLTPEEQILSKALRHLKTLTQSPKGIIDLLLSVAAHGGEDEAHAELLKRMGLFAPRNAKERMYRRLVVAALRAR